VYITVAKFTITHVTIQKLDIGMHTYIHNGEKHIHRHYDITGLYRTKLTYVTKYDLETQTM